MKGNDLLKIYNSTLRAAAEYCSVVYHSLIPDYLSDRLVRVQKQAVKIIFGYGVDYNGMVESGEIETLEQRRKNSCIKFAQKAAASARFGPKWFPENGTTREARTTTRRQYMEGQCRTERSRNNPIQYMIRRLNEQG